MGKFDTHGGHFAPEGYIKVDAGGSHEENPNGGVQLGVDPQGIPNLLEEGEPVYDDYVYSDNIKADEKSLSEHGIPTKYAGKLYSEIADAFVDEAAERPLDDISNRGLQAMLSRLADAQDAQKARKEMRSLKYSTKKMSADDLQMLEDAFTQQDAQTEEAQPQETPEPQMPVEETTMPQETPQVLLGLGMNPMKDGGRINTFETGGDTTPGFLANLIARTNDMDGTSPYTNEKAQAIANGDAKALKAVEDKEAALARTALAGQAAALGGIGMGLRAFTPGAGMLLEGAPATAGAAAEAKNLMRAMQAGAESTYSQAIRNSIMQKYGLSESAMNDLIANAAKELQAEAMTSSSGFANAVVGAKESVSNAVRSVANAVKGALPKRVAQAAASDAAVTVGESVAAEGAKRTIGKAIGNGLNKVAGAALHPVSSLANATLLRNVPRGWQIAANVLDTGAAYGFPGYIPAAVNGVMNHNEDREIVKSNEAEPIDTVANNALFPFDVDENGNIVSVNSKERGGKVIRKFDDGGTTGEEEEDSRMKAIEDETRAFEEARERQAMQQLAFDLYQSTKGGPRLVQVPIPGVPVPESDIDKVRNQSISVKPISPAASVSSFTPLATFPQYAGALTNGVLALYDATQRPTRFTYQRQRPVLPIGNINLIDPIYNPIDQNMSVNDVLAGGASTTRQIANSGMGPSTAAALLAADRNIGRNLGTARTQVAGYNNQLLNGVIGQRNQNASARAQFDYGINQARAQILNNAQAQNAQMDLYTQRLNDAAETQKYSAIQSQLNGIAKALSGIGRQNVALNRLNSNRALYDIAFPNGISGYAGQKEGQRFGGKIEKTKKRR